jgi:hypothetical protein
MKKTIKTILDYSLLEEVLSVNVVFEKSSGHELLKDLAWPNFSPVPHLILLNPINPIGDVMFIMFSCFRPGRGICK